VNEIPAELARAVETPRGMRLEFSNRIAVIMSHPEYEKMRDNRDWVIRFPRESIRVL
jgi:hypothetical protein